MLTHVISYSIENEHGTVGEELVSSFSKTATAFRDNMVIGTPIHHVFDDAAVKRNPKATNQVAFSRARYTIEQ